MATDEFPSPIEFLKDARRDFSEYYRSATPDDTRLFDGLVMAVATLTVGYNALSTESDPVTRSGLERMTVQAEAAFLRLRAEVQACPSYRGISRGMQLLIERSLMKVRVQGT